MKKCSVNNKYRFWLKINKIKIKKVQNKINVSHNVPPRLLPDTFDGSTSVKTPLERKLFGLFSGVRQNQNIQGAQQR